MYKTLDQFKSDQFRYEVINDSMVQVIFHLDKNRSRYIWRAKASDFDGALAILNKRVDDFLERGTESFDTVL